MFFVVGVLVLAFRHLGLLVFDFSRLAGFLVCFVSSAKLRGLAAFGALALSGFRLAWCLALCCLVTTGVRVI